MKTNNYTIFSLLVLFTGTISCTEDIFLEGNLDLQTETRRASGFEEVASNGDFNVMVRSGDSYSVEVRAESNLLSYIETDVVDNTLKIRTRGVRRLEKNYPIDIYITTPVLNGLSISGSGMIITDPFSSSRFRIAISGSCNIDTHVSADILKANVSGLGTIFLKGDATSGEFVLSGSGKIRSYDFEQRNCEAIISGSGEMYVNVSELIDGRISGSGKVFYINHPVVHTSISGSGGVFDRN